MSKRKYIRIALTADDEAAVAQRRAQVYADTGVQLTESMIVLSMIRQSIKDRRKSSK